MVVFLPFRFGCLPQGADKDAAKDVPVIGSGLKAAFRQQACTQHGHAFGPEMVQGQKYQMKAFAATKSHFGTKASRQYQFKVSQNIEVFSDFDGIRTV